MNPGPPGFEFQPIYDLHTREAVGIEALVRWPDTNSEEVFAAARADGTIVELDRAVVVAAVDYLPLIPEPLYLSVNVTVEGIVGDPLAFLPPMSVADRLRIVLEIIEQSTGSMAVVYERLRSLRQLGIRFAIDDVGVAHSNVFRIVQLLPDFLKIDRSLIAGLDGYTVNRAVVRAIAALGTELRCDVVAEGIETRDDLLWVATLGVRFGQGFYLCRPAPLDVALERLTLDD